MRLNEEYRKKRLIDGLELLSKIKFSVTSVRVRGLYAKDAREEITHKFPMFKVIVGDTFESWRLNTLEQVIETKAMHILLLQEDHLMIASPKIVNSVIDTLMNEEIDVCPLSGFQLFKDQAIRISKLDYAKTSENAVLIKGLNNYDINEGIARPGYFITLMSFYSRQMLINLLSSERPYIRKFHHLSPYDVEQSTKQRWFFPINFAIPKVELFACIDDDIINPGSSLQSRGLYPIDKIRTDEQHSAETLSNSVTEKVKKIIRKYFARNGIAAIFKKETTRNRVSEVLHFIIRILRAVRTIKYTLFHKYYLLSNRKERNFRNWVRNSFLDD